MILKMETLNYNGLILGLVAFVVIGVFHPVVAKAEYYFGKRIWWVFFLSGVCFSLLSLCFLGNLLSVILGTIGAGSFWSTHEIFKQHQRVLQGRAKQNPNRTYGAFFLFALTDVAFDSINYTGLLVGAATFVIIAISRYACIKCEYYFTKKFWVVFFLIGIISIAGSLFVHELVISAILGINGFSFLWGIGEIIEQEKRVEKGWFPKRK